MLPFAIDHYTYQPFIGDRVPVDTLMARGVVDTTFGVSGIFRVRGQSKIIDAVIKFVSIFMVNLFRGPFSVMVEPSKTRRGVEAAIKINHSSAFITNRASDGSCMSRPGPSNAPNENSGRRIVIEKITNMVYRYKRLFAHHTSKDIPFLVFSQEKKYGLS